MDEQKSELPPEYQSEGVWPPAPLRHEAPPLYLRVEEMELTHSGDSLTVLNKSIRRLIVVECCILSFSMLLSLLSPFIAYWIIPFHHSTWPGMLAYVIVHYSFFYLLGFLSIAAMAAIVWCVFTFTLSLGVIRLDRRDGIVKRGGRRSRPISMIEAVQITQMKNSPYGLRHIVSLVWSGGASLPWWRRAANNNLTNTSFLVVFWQEANAEKAADVIADFLAVPVQRKATWKRPVSLKGVSSPK